MNQKGREQFCEMTKLIEGIIKAGYAVKKSLGGGLAEANYKRAMMIELNSLGISYQAEARCEVFHRGISCGPYFIDLLVDQSVVVEVKVSEMIIRKHLAQTYNYMNLTGSKEGLILNFGESPLGIRRLKGG